VDYRKIITIESDKLGGKPCIRGMRITVYDEDIRACLAFAVDRERRLATIPA
jgi:uncharacterized protein (DUF433 family)